MFARLTKLFEKGTGPGGRDPHGRSARELRIATCALFLEMAKIDGEFSEAERERILSSLKQEYQLSDADALELMEAADRQLEGSIDLWQFTTQINQDYSIDEKIGVIEILWKIVYADGTLEQHENYLVHKLSDMLHLSHEELMRAKCRVLAARR